MGKMVGVWSFLVKLMVVVGVVVVDLVVDAVVEVMTSVSSVENLVILPENVAYALVLEEWEVEGVEVPVHETAGARVMNGGASVHEEGPLVVAATHLDVVTADRLSVAAATADHLLLVSVKTLLMLMGINVGAGAEVPSKLLEEQIEISPLNSITLWKSSYGYLTNMHHFFSFLFFFMTWDPAKSQEFHPWDLLQILCAFAPSIRRGRHRSLCFYMLRRGLGCLG